MQDNGSPRTIVVGMSGGVDSSVAALLLKRAGHRVIGLFMKNWDETLPDGSCPATQDYDDVRRVCDRLDVPYYAVEFIKEYRERVFAEMLAGYEAGETPNPDILCNREIKFDLFFKKALELGADALATGHYCRVAKDGAGRARLLKGLDPGKDQSYFVHAVTGDVFSRVDFPIGHLLKKEVRELAKAAGLPTHDRKDSTGICFIGERDFKEFLGRFITLKAGDLRLLDGTVVGRHSGAAYYTLGQRRGLGLGGEGPRWFVVGKDIGRNVVFVERGDDHPALYARELLAAPAQWVAGRAPGERFRCAAKIRYRQPDQPCGAEIQPDGRLRVVFDEPQRAITPRQSVVLYQGDECLGGAVIERAGPSLHELSRSAADRPTSCRN